jgi:hypothetical protein
MSASEGANADNRTVKTANLPLPPQQEEPSKATQQGPLTFDPLPLTKEAEEVQLSATNKRPSSCGGIIASFTLPFQSSNSLPSMARFQRSLPRCCLKCAGCLLGAISKLPWQGKETKANHEVFIATKPGECISVDQMTLTEVGFYAKMKGKLTKKCYKCATGFVDPWCGAHQCGSKFYPT